MFFTQIIMQLLLVNVDGTFSENHDLKKNVKSLGVQSR